MKKNIDMPSNFVLVKVLFVGETINNNTHKHQKSVYLNMDDVTEIVPIDAECMIENRDIRDLVPVYIGTKLKVKRLNIFEYINVEEVFSVPTDKRGKTTKS